MIYDINYINKYLKYKLKYLKLKELYGGVNNFYLPCEITNKTKNIYKISSLNIENINATNIYSFNEDFFFQDHLIILKNNENKYRIIQIKDNPYIQYIEDIDNVIETTKYTINTFAYGGNFISSPKLSEDDYGVIFCCKNKYSESTINDLKDLINSQISNQVIEELDCSFCATNGRHIDEMMCFMPYNNYIVYDGLSLNFKIWIYNVRFIKINESNKINKDIKKIYEIIRDNRIDVVEQFIEIFYYIHNGEDDKIEVDETQKKILEHKIEKFLEQDYNITEIIYIYMRIKFKKFEDFDLDKLNKEEMNFYNKLKRSLKFTNIQYINKIYQEYDKYENLINKTNTMFKDELNREKDDNKNKIVDKIFRNYQLTVEQKNIIKNNIFVEFPIDLVIETLDNINIKYLYPPIFNRCWCETNEKVTCIFPYSERDILTDETSKAKILVKEHPDYETQTIFAREIPNIKSILNSSKTIEYLFFNTEQYHGKIAGNTGGNIHCLLKQIFIN